MKVWAELEKQAACQVAAIDDEITRQALVNKMIEIARSENRPGFERDAHNVAASPAIVVIGAQSNPAGLNCGFCGNPTCDELKAKDGICSFNSIDLGIAACSAAAIASNLHVDTRIMYSVGRSSLGLRLFTEDVNEALGIPLSITGKSPFFDRKA